MVSWNDGETSSEALSPLSHEDDDEPYEGYNCGVVEWVDNEWPYALKNSLTKLWALYEEAKAGRISDNLANEEKISKLAAEMKVVQEKYNRHIQLTKDFCESVEKSVHKENYRKTMMGRDEEKIALEAAEKMIKLEKENFDLKEVDVLKQNRSSQAEVVAAELKKENKKLEYAISELWKAGEEYKRKIKDDQGNLRGMNVVVKL